MKKIKEEGMFVFLGYYDAICTIPKDSDKWKMFDAIFKYRMWGMLPDEKLSKHPIFVLTRSMVDGKKKYGGNLNEQKTKSTTKAGGKTSGLTDKELDEIYSRSICGEEVSADNKNKNLIKNNNKNKNYQKEITKEKVKNPFVLEDGKYITYNKYLRNKARKENALMEYRGELVPVKNFENAFFTNLDDVEL